MKQRMDEPTILASASSESQEFSVTNTPTNTTTTSTIKRCGLLPHGWFGLWIGTLCAIGWSANLFQDACNFAKVEGPLVFEFTQDRPQLKIPYLEFGIEMYREPTLYLTNDGSYFYQTTWHGACIMYSTQQQTITGGPNTDNNNNKKENSDSGSVTTNTDGDEDSYIMDAAWTTAKAFSFLATVLGGAGTLFVWCSATCFVFSRGTWKWTAYELLLASLCQAMQFTWFATQICTWNTCSLSWGSLADIVASGLWLVAGMFMLCHYPQPLKHLLVTLVPSQDDVVYDNDHDETPEVVAVVVENDNEDYDGDLEELPKGRRYRGRRGGIVKIQKRDAPGGDITSADLSLTYANAQIS